MRELKTQLTQPNLAEATHGIANQTENRKGLIKERETTDVSID